MRSNCRRHIILILAALGCLGSPATSFPIVSGHWDAGPVIVIDPGHGGYDNGASEKSGEIREKDVSLNLARILSQSLSPDFQVILTRTGDYQLDILERTATANHFRGKLFISLHAGGSFQHQAGGISIWHYASPTNVPFRTNSGTKLPETVKNRKIPWRDIQTIHAASSRRFARLLHARLTETALITPVRIHSGPLPVLEGADMPAVLIETGYISRPADLLILQHADGLSGLTDAIARAVKDFFLKNQAQK